MLKLTLLVGLGSPWGAKDQTQAGHVQGKRPPRVSLAPVFVIFMFAFSQSLKRSVSQYILVQVIAARGCVPSASSRPFSPIYQFAACEFELRKPLTLSFGG